MTATAADAFGLAARLAGAVWGHLIGDAIGVPYEFGPARQATSVQFGAAGAHSQPPGTWSDDGALMLALLDSLLQPAGFDPDDQGQRALAWLRDDAYTPDGDGYFDIGRTTSAAIRAIENGTAALDAGPSGDRDCGNGSLMRILPLALVGRDWPAEELVANAHAASRVTHGHPRCQAACAVYVLAVRELLRGAHREAALEGSLKAIRSTYGHATTMRAQRAALAELEAWPARDGRGFVLDSFWSAWDAFAGAADYADTIRRAVAYGGDTDTTAAIAGGLAGAYWGWASIPADWRHGMRGQETAAPLVDRLVATLGLRTSTLSPLRVDLLDLRGTALEGTGRVGITFLPGKKQGGQAGTHWRDLGLDLAHLRHVGVDALFLLVEDSELRACLVPELPEAMAGGGPELIRFPVHDPEVPASEEAFRIAVADLARRVSQGHSIAIACRGGLDRSGMTAACLYRELGLDADEAIRRTQRARRNSITQPDQQALVRRWPPTPAR